MICSAVERKVVSNSRMPNQAHASLWRGFVNAYIVNSLKALAFVLEVDRFCWVYNSNPFILWLNANAII